MALVLKDRVKETTTTTSTGPYTLAGAVTGFQSFSVIGNGNTTYYTVTDGTDWEVGIGTYTASGTTLSRDTILESSNSGNAVNWGAGSKDVFVTYPAERSVVGSSNPLAIPDPGANGNVLTSNGTIWTSAAPSGGASAITISNKTGAYTVVAGDLGTIINCTSNTFTVSLTAAATLGSGFNCWIWNTGDGTITIDPAGSETIDGTGTSYILRPRAGVQIVCDGTSWITGDVKAYRLYQESNPNDVNYTRPVASGFGAVAIGNSASASGQYAASFGYFARATGAGGIALGFSLASGADGIAIAGAQGLGAATASASNAIAIGVGDSATSTNSTAIGRNSSNQGSQAVTGSGAMALGGSYASGADSFAAAVANNTSSYGAKGTNSIAIGYQARAEFYGIAIGREATASGASTAIAIGRTVTASNEYTYAFGTEANSSIKGKFAFASFGATGTYQSGLYIQRTQTTNNVAKALNFEGTTSYANSQVILPDNSAYAFTGIIVARQQAADGTASAAWKIEGLIRREANAASTTLVTSTVTAIDNTPGWTLALSADTTNGGLKIEATGAVSTDIRWVATVQTSEVTYA